ncbi:MAG: folate-binding protein [Neisseria sp.]|nr:folate-binding protein [Neisseria sp.]
MYTSKLPFFGVVRVSGDERAAFLHGQLSNHIENIAPNQAGYATYNTPKGRVIANVIVLNRGDDLLLLMANDLLEKVVKRLRMFVLRAKVVFEVLPDYAVAGELAQNLVPHIASEPVHTFPAHAADGIWRIDLPHGGVLLVGEANALPAYDANSERAWQAHEIRSGYPWISEASSEVAVAQMINQHIIGGVHFKKGCYPGQEIIARAQYRGQVKRGLAILASDIVPSAGAEILQDGAEAGAILNSVATENGALSLAVIKHGAANGELSDANGTRFTLLQTLFPSDNEA